MFAQQLRLFTHTGCCFKDMVIILPAFHITAWFERLFFGNPLHFSHHTGRYGEWKKDLCSIQAKHAGATQFALAGQGLKLRPLIIAE